MVPTLEQLALMAEEAKHDPSLADYYSKFAYQNGQQLYVPPDQSTGGKYDYMLEGQKVMLPDGRWGIPIDLANKIGALSNQGGFVENFLNGPGAVLLPLGIAGGMTLAAANAAGAGAGAAAPSTSGGSTMFDLFDPSTYLNFGPSPEGYIPGSFETASGIDTAAYANLAQQQAGVFGPFLDNYVPGTYETASGIDTAAYDAAARQFRFPSGTSWLDKLISSPLDALKSLAGGESALSNVFGGNGSGSDIFGGSGFNPISLIPSLGAIAYARNQDPFDTSRLVRAYDSIDPNALALPYDLETAAGRTRLNDSLTNRQVAGSSFGNYDLASYDTLRGLGRQNLLTSGATSQAGIASQILNAEIAQQKNKNDLYGRALLALSGGLSPSRGIADLIGRP